MAHQSLDNEEIINVRWATVDPNPAAQKREARRLEEQAAEAIRAALPASYLAEIEGRDPEQKKRRKIEGSFGLQGYDAPDDVWYAKEKSEFDASRQLDAPDQRLMIKESEEQSALAPQQQDPNANSNGFFSNSTLAALKGFKAAPQPRRPAANAGPSALVGYGSDDDSD